MPTPGFDNTGEHPDNRVEDEIVIFSSPTFEDRIFTPALAPFYTDSLSLRRNDNNVLLQPNVDYKVLQMDRDATLASGFHACFVIYVINNDIPGVKVTYQAVGGIYMNAIGAIQDLIDNLALPDANEISWGQLIGTPYQFNPTDHPHYSGDIHGMQGMMGQLEAIRRALLERGEAGALAAVYQYINNLVANVMSSAVSSTQVGQILTDALQAHTTNNSAHTKAQVGLSAVENLPLANEQQGFEGTSNTRYSTPQSAANTVYGILRQVGPVTTNDPNTSNRPIFLSKHANCPNGTDEFLIINVPVVSFSNENNSTATARIQLAINITYDGVVTNTRGFFKRTGVRSAGVMTWPTLNTWTPVSVGARTEIGQTNLNVLREAGQYVQTTTAYINTTYAYPAALTATDTCTLDVEKTHSNGSCIQRLRVTNTSSVLYGNTFVRYYDAGLITPQWTTPSGTDANGWTNETKAILRSETEPLRWARNILITNGRGEVTPGTSYTGNLPLNVNGLITYRGDKHFAKQTILHNTAATDQPSVVRSNERREIMFSPDGQYVALVGIVSTASNNRRIYIFKTSDWSLKASTTITLTGPYNEIRIAWGPDSDRIFWAKMRRAVYVADPAPSVNETLMGSYDINTNVLTPFTTITPSTLSTVATANSVSPTVGVVDNINSITISKRKNPSGHYYIAIALRNSQVTADVSPHSNYNNAQNNQVLVYTFNPNTNAFTKIANLEPFGVGASPNVGARTRGILKIKLERFSVDPSDSNDVLIMMYDWNFGTVSAPDNALYAGMGRYVKFNTTNGTFINPNGNVSLDLTPLAYISALITPLDFSYDPNTMTIGYLFRYGYRAVAIGPIGAVGPTVNDSVNLAIKCIAGDSTSSQAYGFTITDAAQGNAQTLWSGGCEFSPDGSELVGCFSGATQSHVCVFPVINIGPGASIPVHAYPAADVSTVNCLSYSPLQ